MDYAALTAAAVPTIVAICLGVGELVKLAFPDTPAVTKRIPFIVAACGLMLNIIATAWSGVPFGLDTIMVGLGSGLAATGAYEAGAHIGIGEN